MQVVCTLGKTGSWHVQSTCPKSSGATDAKVLPLERQFTAADSVRRTVIGSNACGPSSSPQTCNFPYQRSTQSFSNRLLMHDNRLRLPTSSLLQLPAFPQHNISSCPSQAIEVN